MTSPNGYQTLWLKREDDPDGPWHPFLVMTRRELCVICAKGDQSDEYPLGRCAVHYLRDREYLHADGRSTLERRMA